MSDLEPGAVPPMRRSKSNEESKAAERERIRAMTIEERMLRALSLYDFLSTLKPAPFRGPRT